MKNFKKILKILLLTTFTVAIGAVLYLSTRQRGAGKPSVNGFKYKEILPGISSEEEVVQKLGNPKERVETPEEIRLKYSSKSTTRDNVVSIKEGKVFLIKEVFTAQEPVNLSFYQKILGETEIILYGKEASASIYLYSYPEVGVAFLASSEKGLLFEVWYFAPTTEEVFRNTVAPDYKENPDELQ